MSIPVSRRALLRAVASGPLVAALPAAWGQESGEPVKRIYIAADDHTDYMWSADEQTYRGAFLESLDHYLDLADQTEDRPSDFQSRWNCDGLLWFREYESNRDAAQVARLVARIKSGHISIPLTMLVSCYGGTPTEAVLRGLYYGGQVERRYDLRLPVAVAMENQTIPLGLGMLWAGSGVRYSWRGICGCASKLDAGGSNRDHDVYWWVGPDGSRILMKWYSLVQPLRRGVYWNEGPGGYAEARHPALAIEFVDSDPEFRRRNPQTVLGLFGQGWDAVKTIVPLEDPDHSFPAVAQRLSNPQRRIIVSNERDYFEDLQAAYGADLPEVSLAFGNEWELYSASLAEVSASVRRATEKLRAAEAMAALVSQQRGEFADDLRPLRDQAWIAFGLYWEHDWTANGPISRERRAAWQRKIARQISDYVDALHERASAALGELLPAAPGVRRILVFNPLCWPRTDHVLIPWDGDEQQATTAFDVAAGQAVPTQWVVRDGKRLLQFLATQVPACGYRLFELRAEAAADPAPRTIEFQDSGLRSARHRLEIGASGSIVAWESLELVRTIVAKGQRANEFEGGIGKVSLESQGPVSTTVRIDVPRPTARTTRIMLLESLDRIEIENTILENFSEVESWRYEFELDAPRTFHEEVGAILQAAVKSQGGDYADRNARTDWLTLNHFVTMHDGATAVTLSNRDCLFFHLGERIKDPMDSASNVIHVLAGGQVDGPELGIPRQGGDRVFTQRFALQCRGGSSTTDRAASMRFALEHSNPLVAAEVTGPGELDPAPRAGLECDSEHVVVWALKPSEDGAGQGTIVRLWNLAEQPCQYTLKMNPPIGKCIQTTHIETDLEPMEVIAGAVTETLASGAIRTLRILPA